MAILNKNGVTQIGEYSIIDFELLNNFDGWSYTPTKDTANSCIGCDSLHAADFSNYSNTVEPLKIHIECDLTYSNFAIGAIASGGVWRCYWQGANYKKETGTWVWEGSNYICSALNTQMTPTNVVTSGATATYHYNTSITIPTSWFTTYSKSQIGFRTDYSSGTGNITVGNMKITLDKNHADNAQIYSNKILANEFIEY